MTMTKCKIVADPLGVVVNICENFLFSEAKSHLDPPKQAVGARDWSVELVRGSRARASLCGTQELSKVGAPVVRGEKDVMKRITAPDRHPVINGGSFLKA